MNTVRLSVDEIVEVLKRSSLPTILCEGDVDVFVLRHVEAKLGAARLSILPCGGRSNLFRVFARRNEYSSLPFVFVADRDMWMFAAVPSGYSEIIFTEGYSIENDLYHYSCIEDLLDGQEIADHREALHSVVRWFAFEVEKFRRGEENQLDVHVSRMLGSRGTDLLESFLDEIGFVAPDDQTVDDLRECYGLRVRGKQLFDLLLRFLNTPGRRAKYSRSALIDLCVRLYSISTLDVIADQIERRIFA